VPETVTGINVSIPLADFTGKPIISGSFPPYVFDLGLHMDTEPVTLQETVIYNIFQKTVSEWKVAGFFRQLSRSFRLDTARK
jgi:hypothetical protein